MPLSRRDALKLGLAAAAAATVGGVAASTPAAASIDANGAASPGTTTLTGAVTLAKLTIPAGSTVEFDPAVNTTLQVSGNVVVSGVLRMRPNPGITHRLQFVGINEANYVGGGMTVLDSDVGLWVIDGGVLDAVGQPKAGWNRTGTDPTWTTADDIRQAPQVAGQYTSFAPFTPGGVVPKVTKFGTDYPTEIFNLTRTVIIGGTPGGRAHVNFLMTTAPQTIRWVRFEYVGPRKTDPANATKNVMVLGRYGLHFHHCQTGSAGSLVEGVVVTGSGTRAFVPHASHGITFRDCVAYDVAQNGYWWDPSITDTSNASNDILYDRCAAFRILPPANASDSGRAAGFELPTGLRNTATGCVTAGASGAIQASGFIWPEQALAPKVWTFTGCTAHNCNSHGLFFWQNDPNFLGNHQIDGFTAYRNFWANIGHGAYTNSTAYRNVRAWGTSRPTEAADFIAGTVTGVIVEDSVFDAEGGPYPPVQISHHSISATAGNPPNVFRNLQLLHPGNRGAVEVWEQGNGSSKNDFVTCTVDGVDLEPAHFKVVYMAPATVVRVQRRDGTAYRLNADGTGTAISPFA